MTSRKYKRRKTLENRIEIKKKAIKRLLASQYSHYNKEQTAEQVLDVINDLEVLIMKRVRRDLSEVEK